MNSHVIRILLLIVCSLLPFARAQAQGSGNGKLRNMVFILTDDHRYDYMGFTGKVPWLETPNLDRMASEGVYLKNAYVTTSLCSPSRATILTGLYAHQHTVVDNVAPSPEELVFFPQLLQKAGYATAFFGKWHMGHGSDEPRPGFDHWESFLGQGVYYGSRLNINGEHVQYGDDVYITDLLTEHALAWMKEQEAAGRPYFVYLSHKAVHSEFKPAPRHEGRYAGKRIPLPPTFGQTKTGEWRELGWPKWVAEQRISWHGVDYMYHGHDGIQELATDYCETLLGVDDSVGAVMGHLREAGLADSTLVIYMGDNGFSWGEHGLIDKRHFYEESAKVPMLVYCPELLDKKGTLEPLVANVDIAPTFLEVGGVKKPDYMPGDSLFKAIRGDSEWRDTIFYEYYWEYDFPMTPTTFGIRSGRYKYIRYQGIWDTNEFYDLEADPDEMHNLIAVPEHQERIKEYATRLSAWLRDTGGLQIPLKDTVKQRWGDYRHRGQY